MIAYLGIGSNIGDRLYFLDKANAPDNFGYCVFGEVVEGIEIVESIGAVSTGNNAGHSDVPLIDIIIETVEAIEE